MAIRAYISVLRPEDDLSTTAIQMSSSELEVTDCVEYSEIWERDEGDDDGVRKRLVARLETGRIFQYIDTQTPEFLHDMQLSEAPVGIFYLVDPHSLCVKRFRFVS